MRVAVCVLLLMLSALPLLAQPPPPLPPPPPLLPALWTPADSAQAALADGQRLPYGQQQYVRYLNIGNILAADRPDLIHVLAGHVNGLSREPDTAAPVILPGTGGAVLRIDIRDYGWDSAVWDRLVDSLSHVKIRKEKITNWPGGTWTDGKYYDQDTFRVKKVVVITGVAPWLGPAGVKLAKLTYSQAPIVNGLWFLWQTAVQQGRGKEGYYDFLKIKDQKTFEQLIRFDARLAARTEQRRVVLFSGVTQEPRRVERTGVVDAGLWRTFDNNLAQEKNNPLRLLDDDDFKFAATEQFAPLPNGMPVWYLGNNKGVRQDKAPDNIVGGERRTHKTLELQVNLDCIYCHLQGKRRGIMDIEGVPLNISSPDYEKYRELKRQYLRDIDPKMEIDRQGYEAAIKSISGLTAEKYGSEYVRWYMRYDEAKVNLAWIARDFGVAPQTLRTALLAYGPTLDPFLSVVARGGAIPVRQYEELPSLIWTALVAAGHK